MGWLITLGVLVLLAVLPLGVSIKYDSEGPLAKVILGPARITVFPLPKKEKKEKKKKENTEENENGQFCLTCVTLHMLSRFQERLWIS